MDAKRTVPGLFGPIEIPTQKNPAMFMSKSIEWSTPREIFDGLNAEFQFTLDVASTAENALCANNFTIEQDSLSRHWAPHRCWMNPPYGPTIGLWMKKAARERAHGAIVVCLVPVRTDTKWFHNYVLGAGAEIRFVRGRLYFGGAKTPAPFPSMVVIYRPRRHTDRLADSDGDG